MTTPPPPPPTGPDDGRDPRVADWLAVDPLDDLTRARLVRTALEGAEAADIPAGVGFTPGLDGTDGSGGLDGSEAPVGVTAIGTTARRRGPYAALVSVAAAVLVALVVVGAVLLPGDDRDSTPTAKSAPPTTPDASRESGDATALAPGSSTGDATAEAPATVVSPLPALPSIGHLGDVSTEALLERAGRAALSRPAGPATSTLTGCAASAGAAFGTPVAAGTGRIDGRKATVVVAEQAAGTTAVVAVRGRTCSRAVSVILP